MLSRNHWRQNADFEEAFERVCEEFRNEGDFASALSARSGSVVSESRRRRAWRRLQEALEDVGKQYAPDPIDALFLTKIRTAQRKKSLLTAAAGGFEMGPASGQHEELPALQQPNREDSEGDDEDTAFNARHYFVSGIVFKSMETDEAADSKEGEVEHCHHRPEGIVGVDVFTIDLQRTKLDMKASAFWCGATAEGTHTRSPSALLFAKVGGSHSEEFRYNPKPFASPHTFTFDVLVKGDRDARASFLERTKLALVPKNVADIVRRAVDEKQCQIRDGTHVVVALSVDDLQLRLPERVPQLPPIQFARSYTPAPLVARHTTQSPVPRPQRKKAHDVTLGDGVQARYAGGLTSKVHTNTSFVLAFKRSRRVLPQTPIRHSSPTKNRDTLVFKPT